MPHVTVCYFAMLREQRGCFEEQLSIAEETVGQLYDRLFPPGPQGQLTVAFAVNQAYVGREQPLVDGDEVAFIPPVGGG